MKTCPVVSFVVPTYNYATYLGDCLAGILHQDGEQNFEVIVIDDASRDHTQEVIRSFADPRLKVITHAENRGHVDTINEGLYAAQGKYVARIDADDRYRTHFLSAALPILDANSDVGLLYGDVSRIDEKGTIEVERVRAHPGRGPFKGNVYVELLRKNFICAPSVIGRREAWQAALPIPAGVAYSDWYLSLQMARRFPFYYVDRVIADYRVHSHNHHTLVIANRTEEPTTFKWLSKFFTEKEQTEELERAKQRSRRAIYGSHYLTLAYKYFGLGMLGDTRRCFRNAILYTPSTACRFEVLRLFIATFLKPSTYQRIKRLSKTALPK